MAAVPCTPTSMIANAEADLVAQADRQATPTACWSATRRPQARDFDGEPASITEMDALIAYLQMLGTLVDFLDLQSRSCRGDGHEHTTTRCAHSPTAGACSSWSLFFVGDRPLRLPAGLQGPVRRRRAHPTQERIRGLTTMATKIENDEITGTATTGHEWDGIKELNTPLPRWWLYTFYATHRLGRRSTRSLYPAWPLLNGATPGVLGYSARAPTVTESIDARQGPPRASSSTRSPRPAVEDILKDPDLLDFAQRRRCGGLQGQLRPVPRLGRGGRRGLSRTSTTTTGSGAARPTQIHTTLTQRHPLHRRMPRRATRRCRPSAPTAS